MHPFCFKLPSLLKGDETALFSFKNRPQVLGNSQNWKELRHLIFFGCWPTSMNILIKFYLIISKVKYLSNGVQPQRLCHPLRHS